MFGDVLAVMKQCDIMALSALKYKAGLQSVFPCTRYSLAERSSVLSIQDMS